MHENPKPTIGNGDRPNVRKYVPKALTAAGAALTLAFLAPKLIDVGLSLGEGRKNDTPEIASGPTVPDCGDDYNMLTTQSGGCIVVGSADANIDFEAIDTSISQGAGSIAEAAIQDLPDNDDFIKGFLADRERYNKPRERVTSPKKPVFSEGFFFNDKGEPRSITFAAFIAGAVGFTGAGIYIMRIRQTSVMGANGKKMPALDIDPATGEVISNRVKHQSRTDMRKRHNAVKSYARETGQRVPR